MPRPGGRQEGGPPGRDGPAWLQAAAYAAPAARRRHQELNAKIVVELNGLPGAESGGREGRLVGRVREVLGLERVPRTLPVGVAADAHQRAVEEVAAVELHARLVGPDGQQPAARRVEGAGGEVEPVRAGGGRGLLVQDPVVVVALGDQQLALAAGGRREAGRDVVRRADVVDPRADGVRRAEVERRARDRDPVGQRQRDLGGVGRRVVVRVHLDELPVRRARRRVLTSQVEVAVVGQVEDRGQLLVVVGAPCSGCRADPGCSACR